MVIFDIEANGLLDTLTHMWCAVTYDLETGETKVFSDYSDEILDGDINDFVDYLYAQPKICGHNIIGYDIPAIERVTGRKYDGELVDTLLISKLLHFTRIQPKGASSRHSLDAWGIRLGISKPKQEQWLVWEEAMLHRCKEDVRINTMAYEKLMEEKDLQPGIEKCINLEHKVALISREQVVNGWLLDSDKLQENIDYLDKEIESLRSYIEPQIPLVVKQKDPKMTWTDMDKIMKEYGFGWRKVPTTRMDHLGNPIKKTFKPVKAKILKSGCYDKWTALWFGITPENAMGERLVVGPYTRIEFSKVKLSQHALVKQFLLKEGWKPTQWTFKKDRDGKVLRDDKNKPINNSPKLTEDSYESIKGEIGNKISRWATLTHRRNTLANPKDNEKGWQNVTRSDGRLVCIPDTLGAATGRMTHKNLVNVPGVKSLFGKEMREVFIAEGNNVLVGADAAGAQLRLLAAAMEDEDYVKLVVDGSEEDENGKFIGTDVHTQNGLAAGLIDPADVEWLRSNDHGHPAYGSYHDRFVGRRGASKNFIYGLLFGAGDAKMGILVNGGAAEGKRLKESFLAGFPKLQLLVDKLTNQYNDSKKKYKEGFIHGADGRRIYVDSPHKVLNYLLQGNEAIYMKYVMCMSDQLLRKNKIRAKLLCFYHDELNMEVHPDDVENTVKILAHSFGRAGEKLDFTCPMASDPKVGKNWYEIH
jgi:hypothetical protein